MQSWRLRLIACDGSTPPTGALIKRLAIASAPLLPMLFGLFWLPLTLFAAAYGWALIDRDGMTWHDRLTSTRPVLDPPK